MYCTKDICKHPFIPKLLVKKFKIKEEKLTTFFVFTQVSSPLLPTHFSYELSYEVLLKTLKGFLSKRKMFPE